MRFCGIFRRGKELGGGEQRAEAHRVPRERVDASLLAHEPARGSTIDSPETDDETGPLWSLPHVVHSTPAERLREVLIRPDAMGADAFVVELTTAEARR